MMKILFILFLLLSLNAKIISIPRNFRQGFHPQFLKEEKSRKDDYPILSVETFRAHADFILDETIWTIDTDKLFDGCVIFVGLRSLNHFYHRVLPYIKNKVVVVSHGGEPFHPSKYSSWERYKSSKDYITPKMVRHPNILAFFEKNGTYSHPKAFCLPLGKSYWNPKGTAIIKNAVESLNMDTYFTKKTIEVYWNMVITHSSRRKIKETWKSCKGIFACGRKPFDEYFSDLQNSKFVLSPRGYGIDCLRTWEALYAGAIPVVESHGIDSVYEGLPIIIVKDLTKVTIEDLEKRYEVMKKNKEKYKLERLFADYWLKKIRLFGENL